ncbi:MAG: NADPH-dependent 7-cyano-7-deazaguanine reductase QueF [Myxococcaceae bacterium]|nr:NADPH-dependent 7-cyano-7-deazaguanine reductase QueF [Myxococcaceae bacterium]
MPSQPSKKLESFKNPAPDRDYEIAFDCPEFTCLCPLTGQPDFARFTIRYTPDEKCVELKSLKLYLWSFRDEGAFHEAVTNRILDDLVKVVRPRKMVVEGDWFIRGGIATKVTASYEQARRHRP